MSSASAAQPSITVEGLLERVAQESDTLHVPDNSDGGFDRTAEIDRSVLSHHLVAALDAGSPDDSELALITRSLVAVKASGSTIDDRCVGALVGLAIADATGAPLEFIPATSTPTEETPTLHAVTTVVKQRSALHYRLENNVFRLKRGQWTDDCSMALCLADSLLCSGARGGPAYDGSDCRTRYLMWWTRGYNNAFRFDRSRPDRGSVGLGGNISKSLGEIERHAGRPASEVPARYTSMGEDAGNGSIMRLAPVAIRLYDDAEAAARMAVESSFATHPGPDAAACCAFLAYATARAIQRDGSEKTTPAAFLDCVVGDFLASSILDDAAIAAAKGKVAALLQCQPPTATEACWDWRAERIAIDETLAARGRSYNGYPNTAGYFGSYSLDGLAMALWAFRGAGSFADTVVRVTNLLGDCDSTGAVAGQLAGAYFGYRGISAPTTREVELQRKPPTVGMAMLQNLSRWDPANEIALRALMLAELRLRESAAAAANPTGPTEAATAPRTSVVAESA